MMNTHSLIFTTVLCSTLIGNAMAMSNAEYKTQRDRISGDYKVNRDKCAALKGNAKDICVSEAKGAEKIAKAELEAQYEPSPRHTEQLALAKADAAYDTAKEKCDDLSGNSKDVCMKDAKAAHVKAKEEAKLARVSTEAGTTNAEKMRDAQKQANTAEREAFYKAAKERCDSLAGDAKEACHKEAEAKYGM